MPVYNEASTVESVIRKVLQQPHVAELIVVDDASTDGTWDVLQKLSASTPPPTFSPSNLPTFPPSAAADSTQVSKSSLSPNLPSPPSSSTPPPTFSPSNLSTFPPSAAADSTQVSNSGLSPIAPSLRAFRHDTNHGKGAALRTGIAHATAPIVIIQDADFEYDPTEYPILLKPILEDRADVVFGSRFIGSEAHRVLYFWHSVGNRFLTLLSNMFTNLNLTDMETCYKMFRREIIQNIKIEENRFGFEPEIVAKVARMHLRIYEVAISYYGRTYAEGKKINWKDGISAVRCIIKYGLHF
jgi:glycosyltransferase involved in cell wall biosynthesis